MGLLGDIFNAAFGVSDRAVAQQNTDWEHNFAMQQFQYEMGKDQELTGAQREANAFSAAEAEKARAFEERMYTQYNSPEAILRQYENAGINPAMMYKGNFTPAPSSSPAASSVTPQGSGNMAAAGTQLISALSSRVSSAGALIGSLANVASAIGVISKLPSEIRANKAAAKGQEIENEFKPDLLRADLHNTEANTSNLAAAARLSSAKFHTELAEAALKVKEQDKFEQEIKESLARVDNINMSTEQIHATIAKLASETELNYSALSLNEQKILTEISKRSEIKSHIRYMDTLSEESMSKVDLNEIQQGLLVAETILAESNSAKIDWNKFQEQYNFLYFKRYGYYPSQGVQSLYGFISNFANHFEMPK